MKVVLAIDSFKGSLSSKKAEEAVACGIAEVMPWAKIVQKPLADGGEGMVEAFVIGAGAKKNYNRCDRPARRESALQLCDSFCKRNGDYRGG